MLSTPPGSRVDAGRLAQASSRRAARRRALQAQSPVIVSGPDRFELLAEFLAAVAWGPTRAIYQQDLEAFFTWCDEEHLDPLRVRRTDVDAWRDWMSFSHTDGRVRGDHVGPEHQGLSSGVVRRRLGTVSRFMATVISRGVRRDNPVARVERPPAQDGPSKAWWLTADKTLALVDAARAHSPLAHGLVCSLVLYGQSAAHAGDMRIDDLLERDGQRQIRLASRKGMRITVALVGRTAAGIDDLLEWHPRASDPSAPLFLWAATGDGIDRRRIGRMVAQVGDRAGIENLQIRVLRHTFMALARAAHVPADVVVQHTGTDWGLVGEWEKLQTVQPPAEVERLLKSIDAQSRAA